MLDKSVSTPRQSFYARRLYGFPPSVWFDSDEESEAGPSLEVEQQRKSVGS